MAENESLDLLGRHSGRWRQLLRKIECNECPEDIADEAVRCLYQTFKNLVESLPLPDLIDAARRGPECVHEIVLQCRRAREYAELFAQCSTVTSDPVALIVEVARGTCERFLDQIEMKVVGAQHWPNMSRFRLLRQEVTRLMKDDVHRLAQKIASDPSSKPRMPARSAERKEQDQRDLLGLSIRARKSGTHG